MRRPAMLALWAVVLSLGTMGCATGSVAPASTPSAASGSSAAPTSGSTQPPTPTPGTPTAGASATVVPTSMPFGTPAALPQAGRILFVIEGPGPSQPVILDQTGLHLVPAADSTFAHATWASSSSLIFDSQRSGGRHLYRMGLDGSNVVQLTSGTAFQERASVSADGTTIAYDDYLDATSQDLGLHIAQVDGTQPRALTPGGAAGAKGGDTWAAISPDGQWVAFERAVDFDARRAGLFVVRIDGTGLRRLTDDTTDPGYPKWSPDGLRILYTGHYDGNFQAGPLWVVNLAGGAPVALTNPTDPGWSFEGDWSPDGSQVVFKYYRAGWDHNELRVANVDGSHETTLWAGPSHYTAETPDWGR